MPISSSSMAAARLGRWCSEPECWLLALIVVAIYFSRLTALPVAGEEARWASGAMEMMATGDWVVLRQQGQVFPERPPMSSWAMAAAGLVWGDMDEVAIRLPSVLAVLLTCMVIYGYARLFLTRFGAFSAGAIYATMGQVLQLGRMGESEALFALLVSASLLIWHAGHMRCWAPVWMWSAGYGLAALGALVKGPQAPVYFVAVTAAYLAYQRNWRQMLCVGHLVGLAVLAGIIALWQVPYYWATDWPSVAATWGGLAGDRITLDGLIPHVLAYPWETLGCLLPWSPLLLLLAKRPIRQTVAGASPYLVYLTVAIAVTYPTVWLAAHARGRYFMPLYPCFALLIGLVVQACVQSETASRTRRDWNNFLRGLAAATGVCGVYVLCVSWGFPDSSLPLRQPFWLAAAMALAAVVVTGVLLWAVACRSHRTSQAAVVATVVFLGLFSSVVLLNHYAARWNDARPQVARIKSQIPDPRRLVSFGPIDHRFAYFYRDPIQQLPWPVAAEDVPAGVTYFCMNQFATDTAQQRDIGRGRTWTKVPGTLPVTWEPVATVCCERHRKTTPESVVIVGRIVEPVIETAEVRTAPGTRER